MCGERHTLRHLRADVLTRVNIRPQCAASQQLFWSGVG